MPCRLRFNFAFTNKRCLDLVITQASGATLGDIMQIMYEKARGIPANAGIDLVGSRSFTVLSRTTPGRYVWRPTRARRAVTRLWPGIAIRGKRRIRLHKHCHTLRQS